MTSEQLMRKMRIRRVEVTIPRLVWCGRRQFSHPDERFISALKAHDWDEQSLKYVGGPLFDWFLREDDGRGGTLRSASGTSELTPFFEEKIMASLRETARARIVAQNERRREEELNRQVDEYCSE